MKPHILPIKVHRYEKIFDEATIQRGQSYYKDNHVIKIDVSNNGKNIISKIQGTSAKPYRAEINIRHNKLTGDIIINGNCSCPVGFNCKHVFASLLKADEKPDIYDSTTENYSLNNSAIKIDNKISSWINNFGINQTTQNSVQLEPQPDHQIVYVIELLSADNEIQDHINIFLYYSKCLVNGGYSKPRKFNLRTNSHQYYLQAADLDIIATLQFLNRTNKNKNTGLRINGAKGTELFKQILNTKRCYWQEPLGTLISLGKNEKLTYSWETKDNLNQKLNVLINNDIAKLIILDRIWYVNTSDAVCGFIDTDLSLNTILFLLQAPEISPDQVGIVQEHLRKAAPNHDEILPNIIKPIAKIIKNSVPCLKLNLISTESDFTNDFTSNDKKSLPTAEISFDYDGYIIPFSSMNSAEVIDYIDNGNRYKFKRDFIKEKEHIINLLQYIHLEPLNNFVSKENQPDIFVISSVQDDTDYLNLNFNILPALEEIGWNIIRDDEIFAEVLLDEDLSWYSELDEESDYDYFGFNLGIEVDNEKIDILPIVSEIIQNISPEEIANLPNKQSIPLPLPSGKILSVPYARLKPILNILVELYDRKLTVTDGLKLAKHQALLLHEIEQAFKAAKMRWFGGERMRQLGKNLANFKSIKPIIPPKTFNATLRNYQQEGVSWLQFLREHKMNGILADDMGLGKTVQTLAHLSIEKHKKRIYKPSVIVAPTSLMVNWHNEAEKFTSNLNVLTYHGDERHIHKDNIHGYDIIFTTYPLLLRDKEIWLKNKFYYLILDEAQYIKNHKAKSTQIAHQINAEHRLCLTGTPMENNLTELWSLFHFLMPGMLGNNLQFKQQFRTPIEKNNDGDRQQILSKRIRPFLLRRKKSQVLEELPEKTIIIKTVELTGKQRDLYESIRLAMEQKIRKALQEKGLSRSHIVILDAILKLRQTCCHPKLLQLPTAKKAYKTSAKTDMLMEMLPNMIAEGRKIIIFSQFTKMLEIISKELESKCIQYSKLTGATRNRKNAIDLFQDGDASVFLISLKAGGTGLNLTAADTVIHYDPWWNPAAEDQATDRAHRIGQKKSVFVYKLLASGTIEETIHDMQQKKRHLIEGLLTEKRFSKLNLSRDDLEHFFRPI